MAGVCLLSAFLYYFRVAVSHLTQGGQDTPSEEDVRWKGLVATMHEKSKETQWRSKLLSRMWWLEDRLQNGSEDEREMSAILLADVANLNTTAEARLIAALDAPSPR